MTDRERDAVFVVKLREFIATLDRNIATIQQDKELALAKLAEIENRLKGE